MELLIFTKVLTHANVANFGTEIMAALILVRHASNFEIMYKMKDKLTATKLSNFTGDDVELYCDQQLGLLQQLDHSGLLQHHHLSCLTCSLTRFIRPSFQLWALNQNKVVSEFCFKTQHMDLSLIPEADRLDFEEIICSSRYEYKQLVYANNWTPVPGSDTPAAETTLTYGYQAALPTEPVAFHTMICQSISTAVSDSMSASTQANPPPKKVDGGRGGRSG